MQTKTCQKEHVDCFKEKSIVSNGKDFKHLKGEER